jgi:hypothetical protein
MTENYRYHRASQGVQVVIVEVPAAGSPQPLKQAKPGKYPVDRRAPWRPQRSMPLSRKAEGLRRLLDAISRNDAAARSMLTPNAAMLKAWLAKAA